MFQRLVMLIALGFFVNSASFAQAEEDNSCSQSCPSGQVKSSFLDGDHVTCVCMEPGVPMEDNPADANPPSGGEGQES